MTEPIHFDEYSENYDAALNEGISVTGEVKDYFARRRVEWLARSLQQLSEQPKSVMDYGCGDGSTTPLFSELLKAEYVTGALAWARETGTRSRHRLRVHARRGKRLLVAAVAMDGH